MLRSKVKTGRGGGNLCGPYIPAEYLRTATSLCSSMYSKFIILNGLLRMPIYNGYLFELRSLINLALAIYFYSRVNNGICAIWDLGRAVSVNCFILRLVSTPFVINFALLFTYGCG